MKDLKLNCGEMDERLADLLFDPAAAPAEVHKHVAGCDACRRELDELKATMDVMEGWDAPEPSPFFVSRVNARVRAEAEAAPAGWLGRLRARFGLRPQAHVRPLAAMSLTLLLLLGGGAYLSVTDLVAPPPPQHNDAALVHDLQTLENNAQVLDTLENLSAPSGEGN